MAEELKCVLMSTPKYRKKESWRSLHDDKLRWSPDSIVAHGNLMPRSGDLDPVVKDSGDYQVSRPHPNPYHHPPWRGRDLSSPTPSSYTHNRLYNDLHLHQDHPPTGSRLFGVPSSSAKCERAADLGIHRAWMEASFEGNQSFPKVTRQRRSRPDPTPGDITMNPAVTLTAGPRLEALQGDGMNDISFASSQPRKKYFPRLKDVPQPPPPAAATTMGGTTTAIVTTPGGGYKTLSESWSFSGFLGNASQQTAASSSSFLSSSALPSTVRNPNKAICTIVASTSEILTANDMACELFGYEEGELVGRSLRDLLRLKSRQQEAVGECHLEPSGHLVSLAGKVVEVLDSHGLALPISLWVKRLDPPTTTTTTSPPPPSSSRHHQGEGGGVGRAVGEGSRLLCVMEPVERTVGHVTFDAQGEVQWCDDHLAQLCGYAGPHQVCGLHMTQLIPAFHCPDPSRGLTKEVKKQRATGRTRDGMSFPLSMVVRPDDDDDDDDDHMKDGRWIPPGQEGLRDVGDNPLYRATVWVFANISGLISIRPDGTIHSLNDNFARLLFGYNRSELIGHSISKLIPDFFDLLELESDPLPLPPLDDEEEEEEVEEEVEEEEECETEMEQVEVRNAERATLTPSPSPSPSTLQGTGFEEGCCTPLLSPREGGRGRRSPYTSTPTVCGSGTGEDVVVPVTSTPCRREDEEEEVESFGSESPSSGGSSRVWQKEGDNSRQQKDGFPADDSPEDFSPLLVHTNVSCPATRSGHNRRHVDDSNNEEKNTTTENCPHGVRLDGSKSPVDCASRAIQHGSGSGSDDEHHSRGGDGHRGSSSPHGSENLLGREAAYENLIGESDGVNAIMDADKIGRGWCDARKNPDVIGSGFGEEEEVEGEGENGNTIGEEKQNDSIENACARESDSKPSFSVSDCRDVVKRTLMYGGDGWFGRDPAEEGVLGSHDPMQGQGGGGNRAGEGGVIGCEDIDVDVEGELSCDNKDHDDDDDAPPSPHTTADDDDRRNSGVQLSSEVCTMLSPIKAVKPRLFHEQPFIANSFTNDDVDDDVDVVGGDTTDDLLTAKVSACDISDVSWSEEEEEGGQGSSLGQGVAADVSGNVEEESLNRGSAGEGRRSSLEDGRMSRLSHSDPFCLRSKIILDGLGDMSSRSSTEEEEGELSGPPEPFLARHAPYPCPHLPSFLDTSGAGAGSATYLEDESSYFSRDGASLSNPATDSTGSYHSSSGCIWGVSEGSVKDPGAEGGRRKKVLRDAATNVSGEAGIKASQTSPSSAAADASGAKVGGHPGGCHIPEGSFSGQGRHKDGGSLGIVFQIRRVVLTDGSHMLLLWLSRDPEDVCDASRSHGNLTLASSFCSTLDQSQHSMGELLQEQANSDSKLQDIQEAETPDHTTTLPPVKKQSTTTTPTNITSSHSKVDDDMEKEDDDDDDHDRHEVSVASAGEFSEHYTTLTSIGKGAFGFVKLGRRRRDGQEVVVKFIRRAKVLRESWVKDTTTQSEGGGRGGLVPMEVYLLVRLNHPNIVKVLDVHQNTDFIQLVMERHGSGMDLFEFIDRNPVMDESLTSYIFRQMVAGVSYLHSQNVVHRDIKDENIIIDERFRIKLIDFGAATYMLPGRLFATFCGTIEYCSPEVLSGNKYRGPELEMWSLGITLYTLIFGENPFFDVEETLNGVLKPPSTVSRALMFLITWLLQPDPLCRATVSDVERNAWVNQAVDMSQYQWETVLPNTEFYGNTACDNREDSVDHSCPPPSIAPPLRGKCCGGGGARHSPDSFSSYGTAKDISNTLSSANTSAHRSHGSTAHTPHSSADSCEGEAISHDHSALCPGSRHSSGGVEGEEGEGGNSRGGQYHHAGHRIAGVASDLNRLLHLHDRLDDNDDDDGYRLDSDY